VPVVHRIGGICRLFALAHPASDIRRGGHGCQRLAVDGGGRPSGPGCDALQGVVYARESAIGAMEFRV
jgi:hypothetical protein